MRAYTSPDVNAVSEAFAGTVQSATWLNINTTNNNNWGHWPSIANNHFIFIWILCLFIYTQFASWKWFMYTIDFISARIFPALSWLVVCNELQWLFETKKKNEIPYQISHTNKKQKTK